MPSDRIEPPIDSRQGRHPITDPPSDSLIGCTLVVDRNGLHVYGLVAYATNWPELVGPARAAAMRRARTAIDAERQSFIEIEGDDDA